MKWFCLLLICSTLHGWSQQRHPIELSTQLLHNISAQQPTAATLQEIAGLEADSLVHWLPSDNHKMAFWINLFNAFTQICLQNDPSLVNRPRAFWKQQQFEVAGQSLSLKQIYHGILRHSKKSNRGGSRNKWWVSKFEKANRVQAVNPQIHFALNTGISEAPQILVYREQNVMQLLSLATKAYLQKLNAASSTHLVLPQFVAEVIFDFEKSSGIHAFVQNNGITANQAALPIRYMRPSAQLRLNNFWVD